MAEMTNTGSESKNTIRPPTGRRSAWQQEESHTPSQNLRDRAERAVPHHLHTASIMGQTLHGWIEEVLDLHAVARIQGACYLVLGGWTLFHVVGLQELAGINTQAWLIQSAGGIMTALGLTLLTLSFSEKRFKSVVTLGLGSAFILGAAGVALVTAGRLNTVYLGDAALEGAFAGWWLLAQRHHRARSATANSSPSAQKLSNIASRARLH